MKINERFTEKLNNFKKEIPISDKGKNTSAILLFKDYLSKMYLWYEHFGKGDQWEYYMFKTIEGHNLLNLTEPTFLSNCIDLDIFRTEYLENITIDKNKYRGMDFRLLYYALYFAVYIEDNAYHALPNPYEPILILLKRGNHIGKGEMSKLEIDSISVKKTTDFILPSLDVSFLNYIDSNSIRVGSSGIPNQETTNNLWMEFKLIHN